MLIGPLPASAVTGAARFSRKETAMKLRDLPMSLVLIGAIALFSVACDTEETSSGSTDDGDTAATASEAQATVAAGASADEESGPVAPQMFESTKQLMAEQIEGLATQVDTLTKVAAEYKDEQLDALLKEASDKVAACRTKMAEVTQANSGTTLVKEVPALVEDAGKVIEKAMLRQQEVAKAKMGGGGA